MALLEEPPIADPTPAETPRRRVPLPTWWVSAVTVAYVALSVRWITGVVGFSHDGQNLGVFALGSRGMRDLGVVESRGGSILGLGNGSYAHHPPLLVWSTFLSESIFGVHPWTARLPTTIAAVAVIWLLYGLLRDLRLGAWPAAVGVTFAVFTPMFLVYGWMPDTLMLALPFALAVTRWWVRAGRDHHVAPPVTTTVAVVAALGAMAGWEFSLWCGLLVAVAWSTRSTERPRWEVARPIFAGVVIGLGLTAAWVAASRGGIHDLIDAFSTRTGVDATEQVTDSVRANLTAIVRLTGPLTLVLAPFALWQGGRDRRTRQLLGLTLVGVVAYAAIFWQASSMHDYWNEWLVVPIAIAFAAGAAAVIKIGRRMEWSSPVGWVLAVTLIAAVWAPLVPTAAQDQLVDGARISRQLASVNLPADQKAWLVTGIPSPRPWVSYVTDRPLQLVDTWSDLANVATRHPDWMIVGPCTTHCAAMAKGGITVDGFVINRVGVIAEVGSALSQAAASSTPGGS